MNRRKRADSEALFSDLRDIWGDLAIAAIVAGLYDANLSGCDLSRENLRDSCMRNAETSTVNEEN
jgi:uncharacterized protein YjbI with pentapeptide repeats